MPPSLSDRAELQAAVDRANQAIRGFWDGIAKDRLPSPAEWVEHERLQDAWGAAVAARGREAEDEVAAALTAA